MSQSVSVNVSLPDTKVLVAAQCLMHEMGSQLEIEQVERDLPRLLVPPVGVERVILLLVETDADVISLRVGGTFPLASETERAQFKHLRLPLHNRERDPVLQAWFMGQSVDIVDEGTGTALLQFAQFFGIEHGIGVPLRWKGALIGALLADNPVSKRACTADQGIMLNGLADTAALIIHNAIQHSSTVRALADMMYELRIMRQIDRELNENIGLEHVYDMTLDWALRYTNANYAALALYDEAHDTLQYVAHLGYDHSPGDTIDYHYQGNGGIAQRVARSGRSEIVPDVSVDSDYVAIMPGVRSHLSVPLLREDRVIAVISVESKKLNGLGEAHRTFIEKLGQRAGVAIDNARLYAHSEHERAKLSAILAKIGDVVIVVSQEGRLILINQSAVDALRLDPHRDYVGESFLSIFAGSALEQPYRKLLTLQQTLTTEVVLPNDRVYSANLVIEDPIGCIIVLHDITYLKETDQLKTDLISTVSHDLKQPLAVMRGYIELLQMRYPLEPRANQYLDHTLDSIQGMLTLIDDLLNMANLEKGIQLQIMPVDIAQVINRCIEILLPLARRKSIAIDVALRPDLPPVAGDHKRLEQVFSNVIGNAVKYTPPGGQIRVSASEREGALTVAIADTGIGISPEDQGRIFDRFYRVRRPETKNIEGTGIGLSIVKRLVEAHNGQIGLESTVGEGTTFYISLPLAQ